ncbi:MAG: ribonuclease H-like domain-containing protein [Burkholderiales bacterium]|nr:ribonuclease H-like domain-containing protein [Burkholderiales bacterium]
MLFIDVETLPTQDEAVIAELRKSITPPATIKKPESIEKWNKEERPAKLKDLIHKTGLDGLHGSIACIAWAIDDCPVMSTDSMDDERNVLACFFDVCEQHLTIHESLCGHNIAGFDLPFIKHRAIINGMKPPITLLSAMNAKPWEDCIQDTMLIWSQDRQKRVSMDSLCKALGIEGKGDFEGSMVAETWPTNPEKVIEYCKDDVERARKIYKKLTFQG